MPLVYLSPVPWGSFAQRPQKLVEWFHSATGADVIWLEPYPTRFPKLSDIFNRTKVVLPATQPPSWLRLVQPKALPVEPLPFSELLNNQIWHREIETVQRMLAGRRYAMVIGKPSVLALQMLDRLHADTAIYDAMDDFPAFYSGLSAVALGKREQAVALRVNHVLASSTAIYNRWSAIRADVSLVHNALDLDVLPEPRMEARHSDGPYVFGYIGTIGSWFDWEFVKSLAIARPLDEIRLIGPVYSACDSALPSNVTLLPPCDHHTAMVAIADFDVGLIPFKDNRLTAGVDPIKYYEYRGMGLPVLSSSFGEMASRASQPGVYLYQDTCDVGLLASQAVRYRVSRVDVSEFRRLNSWDFRFSSSEVLARCLVQG